MNNDRKRCSKGYLMMAIRWNFSGIWRILPATVAAGKKRGMLL